MTERVILKGYRETMRALNKVDKDTKKTVRDELKKVAEPIAATARELIAQYPGASTGTIGPRVVTNGVYVTQRKKKVTGAHPEFGALQMTKGLIPALDQNADKIERGVEDALDHLIQSNGF